MRPFLSGHIHHPGPATMVYYPVCSADEPTSHQSYIPMLGPETRLKLSKAFSLTYLLEPHAIVRSYLDRQSFWSYKDESAIDSASLLYIGGGSPTLDLQNSHRSVYSGWITRHLTTHLSPSN